LVFSKVLRTSWQLPGLGGTETDTNDDADDGDDDDGFGSRFADLDVAT